MRHTHLGPWAQDPRTGAYPLILKVTIRKSRDWGQKETWVAGCKKSHFSLSHRLSFHLSSLYHSHFQARLCAISNSESGWGWKCWKGITQQGTCRVKAGKEGVCQTQSLTPGFLPTRGLEWGGTLRWCSLGNDSNISWQNQPAYQA